MGTYDSMKKRLTSTGLYSLDGTTVADTELQAFAAGLDPVRDGLDALQKESFVADAEDYGLLYREQACGIAPETETARRREVLLALGAVTPNSGTKAGLERLFAALGLSVSITEDTAGKMLTARFLAEPACGRGAAQKLLEKFMPAHLTAVPDFSGLS